MRRAAVIAAAAALLALIAMCSMSLLLVEEKASHSGSSLYGDGNAEVCWNFLKGKGFSDAAAAGIIGNWQVESGIEPRQCQHGTFAGANGESLAFPYDPPEASLSDDYPAALVDNGSFGYGIAQWTYPSRARGLVDYAESIGKRSGDLESQLGWFWEECGSGYPGVLAMMSEDDPEVAAVAFHDAYEGSADVDLTARQQAAREAYAKFSGKTTVSASTPAAPSSGSRSYGCSADLSQAGASGPAGTLQKRLAQLALSGEMYGCGENECEKWAEQLVRQGLGLGVANQCCATAAEEAWRVSADRSSIPIGAAVFGNSYGGVGCPACGRDAGHVAIYVGDGKCVGNEGGRAVVHGMDEWVSLYGWKSWGWIGGHDLASMGGSAVVDAARQAIGKPYVYGATGPDGFDCSGLVWWSLKQAGQETDRLTAQGYWQRCQEVSRSELMPGDLVFWNAGDNHDGQMGHVAIYAGDGKVVQAATDGVKESRMEVGLVYGATEMRFGRL